MTDAGVVDDSRQPKVVLTEQWWEQFEVREAARRCDPFEDLIGFFEALSDVIDTYRSWWTRGRQKSAG